MGFVSETSEIKKSSSRRRSSAYLKENPEFSQTHKISSTHASYQYNTWSKAGIYLCVKPTSKDIQRSIDIVTMHTVSKERFRRWLLFLKYWGRILPAIEDISREDESIKPIRAALSAMDHNEQFLELRKNNIRFTFHNHFRYLYATYMLSCF